VPPSPYCRTGLTLLAHSNVPFKYWEDAFDTACYLINCLPSLTHPKSPFELLFNKLPDYTFLKTFGCECWPYLRPYNSHKFSYHSKSCLFLGYSEPHLGYKCLDLSTGRLYIARHLIFNEQVFPFKSLLGPPPSSAPLLAHPLPTNMRLSSPAISPFVPHLSSNSNASPLASSPLDFSSHSSTVPTSPAPPPDSAYPMITRAQSNIRKPRQFNDGTVRYPLPRALTTSLVSTNPDPTCFSQAVKQEVWRAAMAEEFHALLKNGTWTLVPSQPSINIVGCKWVFKTKRKVDGSIDRYKARLVAKGFHHQSGIDYTETYSLVIKLITIWTVLSLTVSYGWPIKQIDVSNAFLHGSLSEKVYMAQPPGFVHPQYPTAVCLLKKALYGLKQAPRAWFSRLSSHLLEFGFSISSADSSLFLFKSAHVQLMVLVYVDDLILTSSSHVALDDLFHSLSATFPIKDLGPLSYFLGVEVIKCAAGLHLSQHRYITDLLHKTNMILAKPFTSPMAASTSLSKFAWITLTDATLYRSTVGALQYLAITRPDIAFVVNKCSQFMHDPRDVHWTAVKCIL